MRNSSSGHPADTRDLALQPIEILLIGRRDTGRDGRPVRRRIEGLLPTDECPAALIGERDAENEVMLTADVLDVDPVRGSRDLNTLRFG